MSMCSIFIFSPEFTQKSHHPELSGWCDFALILFQTFLISVKAESRKNLLSAFIIVCSGSIADTLPQNILVERKEVRVAKELRQRNDLNGNRDIVVKAEIAGQRGNGAALFRDLLLRQIGGQENVNIGLGALFAAGVGTIEDRVVDLAA